MSLAKISRICKGNFETSFCKYHCEYYSIGAQQTFQCAEFLKGELGKFNESMTSDVCMFLPIIRWAT